MSTFNYWAIYIYFTLAVSVLHNILVTFWILLSVWWQEEKLFKYNFKSLIAPVKVQKLKVKRRYQLPSAVRTVQMVLTPPTRVNPQNWIIYFV